MMTEAFKAHLKASPFHPIAVHLNDGRSIPVKHPDFVVPSPKGREEMVWTKAHRCEFSDLAQSDAQTPDEGGNVTRPALKSHLSGHILCATGLTLIPCHYAHPRHKRSWPFHGLRFAVFLATTGLSSLAAEQPRLEPLLKPGLWTNAPSSTIQDVAVQGNYAYVAHRLEGLKIIDVSDPSNPVRVGELDTTGDALGVAVAGNYAYVADGSSGLEVIDIRDPAHPVHVGGSLLPAFGPGTSGHAREIALSGNYAYVIGTDGIGEPLPYGGLHVIDVSNPTNCVLLSKCATVKAPIAVQIAGNFAYLATFDGMEVVYVGDPSNAVSIATHPTGTQTSSVAVSGNRAYLWRDQLLRILDITNPTNVIHISTVTVHDNPLVDSGEIALAGNYAFMACEYLGVRVFDVTDPTNAEFVTSFSTGGHAYTVNVAGGHIFVGDYPGGLHVFPTIPDVQFTMRIHADPGVSLTLESTTNLVHPIVWTQLVTTNLSANQFDFADLDVGRSKRSQKHYRVMTP
jgi:hypothetical protein